jgi:hypothetical protein
MGSPTTGATERPARGEAGMVSPGDHVVDAPRSWAPSTQVSLEPPPWLELTTRLPSVSATRVSPPGSTHTRSPSFTAKGRRSTWRGTMAPSTQVGEVDSDTVGWAIQLLGEASTMSASSSSSALEAWGPMTSPLPPEPSTRLNTSSWRRLIASRHSSSL